MAVINVVFNKVSGEKNKEIRGKVGVNTNLNIESVSEAKINFDKNSVDVINVDFIFSAVFDPELGKVTIGGTAVLMEDEKTKNEILSSWKESKKLPESKALPILNIILNKSQLEVAIISKELNLPLPFKLPQFINGEEQKPKQNINRAE